jgi:hypothetical protein
MWSRRFLPKVAIWLNVAAAVWGLASSNTLVRPSQKCWHHRRTISVEVTSGPYAFTRRLWMLAGHALFRCPVFNTTLRRHRLCDEGRTSHNKRGRLPVDTENSDTPPVLRGPRKYNEETYFPTVLRMSHYVSASLRASVYNGHEDMAKLLNF